MELQNRLNKLPPAALKFYTGLSAWTATLLFMWGPVAQAVSSQDIPLSLWNFFSLVFLLVLISYNWTLSASVDSGRTI